MKRGTPDHPKTLDLAQAIHDRWKAEGGILAVADFIIAHTYTCGLLERLWHFTARYAPSGLVAPAAAGSVQRIARAVGWPYDPEWLVSKLLETGWLDRVEEGGFYVHDWHVHSDDAVDKRLAENGLRYANGSGTRRKTRPPTESGPNPVSTGRDKSALPKPEPEPEPKPTNPPLPPPPSADGNGDGLAGPDFGRSAGRLAGRIFENSWAGVREALVAVGVDRAVEAQRSIEANDCTPDHAHALIRFAEATGKGPGAIVERFKAATPSLAMNRGWPNGQHPEAKQRVLSESEQARRAKKLREENESLATALIKKLRKQGITSEEAINAELTKAKLEWPR